MMRPVSLPGSLVPLCAALAFLRSARAVRSQKTGHNRVLRLEAQGIKSSILRQPVWVLGLVGMISGEVGNLAAYGDPGTPAAVITAVGCVGVVANLFIATLFLKEPFRYRDLMGSTLVVGGVCLLAIFKLEPEAPLTGERLNMMLYSPGAIGVYCVYGGSILFFLLTIKRIGDIHVIFYLLLSSFIGAFTVISAKPVSTFVIKSFNGIFSGTFSDVLVDKGVKLDDGTWKFSPYAILSAMECAEYDPISVALGFDGTKWVKLQNTADAEILSGRSNALEGCYHRGTGELHQPAFWIFIVILIATAIAQVKYLNDALARFDNSEVIPTHYVCFTLLSVTGATVVYQEWHIPMHAETGCSMTWRAHLFLDGMMCTILGVYFITTMRGAKRPKGSQSFIDGDDDFDDDPIPPPMASISEESATNNTPVTAVTIGSSGGSNVEQVKLKLGTSTEPGEGTPLKGDESAPNTPSRISDRPPSLISSQSSSNNRLIERRGSALGDLKRQGSSGMFPGLELAPVPAPAPLADAEAAPSAQAPPYRASSSTGSRISTKQKSRQSFVEQVAAVLPIPQLSGIDARSPGRAPPCMFFERPSAHHRSRQSHCRWCACSYPLCLSALCHLSARSR
jgi:hypothetical protein